MAEIISPWGSYKKAMIAAKYGADAVYVGVPFLSLRMRQNKLKDFEILKKTIRDLQAMGKKAYLTINIFPRNTDIKIIESTIEQISDTGADSVIFSDPGVYNTLKRYMWDKVNYHLSTQTNTLNYEAVKFWYDLWVDRVVLAREVNIKEIIEIKKHVPWVEIEAFVHGAMCMTYSGRCLLGEYFSGRDGNKWECSHVCRYKFKTYIEEERRPGKLIQVDQDESGTYLLSSKDLCTIEHGQELYDHIDAWKIEWRSKSEFYVGSVTKAYSHLRDSIANWTEANPDILDLVNKIPHRYYWDGFLFNDIRTSKPEGEPGEGIVTTTQDTAWPIKTKQYIWTITDIKFEKDDKTYFQLTPKHNILVGDTLQVLDISGIEKEIIVDSLLSKTKESIERVTCNHPDIWLSAEGLWEWNIMYIPEKTANIS